jgi:hypothetical protein
MTVTIPDCIDCQLQCKINCIYTLRYVPRFGKIYGLLAWELKLFGESERTSCCHQFPCQQSILPVFILVPFIFRCISEEIILVWWKNKKLTLNVDKICFHHGQIAWWLPMQEIQGSKSGLVHCIFSLLVTINGYKLPSDDVKTFKNLINALEM